MIIMLVVFAMFFVLFVVFLVHSSNNTTLLQNRNVAEDHKHCDIRVVVIVVVKYMPALDELVSQDVIWGK